LFRGGVAPFRRIVQWPLSCVGNLLPRGTALANSFALLPPVDNGQLILFLDIERMLLGPRLQG
jgi:hypothetical protein